MIQIPTRCSDGLRSLPQISKLEQFRQLNIGFQHLKNVKLSGLGLSLDPKYSWILKSLILIMVSGSHVKNEPLKVKHSKQLSLVTIKNSHLRQKKFIQRSSKRKIFQNLLKNHLGTSKLIPPTF